MKRSLWLGAMLLCILVPCTLVFGQSATTSLRGVITDSSGALVPGATVTITDKTIDKTLTAQTGAHGEYTFAQIPPATYLITASAPGLGSQSKQAELLVNQPATINFALTVQASSVTVDVSASAQTLNTTDASEGNSFGNAMIQSMPMDGRDPVSLLALQPGVLYLGQQDRTGSSTDSRQGAVSGSRSDQGNVTLDGIDDNDQINGYAFFGVLRSTLDSTEEFRVTTSNGTADAGRSSGAQISLITKSGTNKFHGAAYEYNRPTNLVSNNFFLKNQQVAAGQANRPTKYVLNTFGGSVGGPIWKDKLYFFFNYEGQRHATNDAVTAITPSQTFLNGQIGYLDVNGNTQMLTSAQIAQLDKNCTLCTTPGVNQAMLQYLSTEPAATVLASGDGINNGGYTFSSPAPGTQNTSIFKLDYDLNSKSHIFARGNLQKDTQLGDENLPGQPAASTTVDNTKGMAFGWTWTPTSTITNDLRYAYIRQGYGDTGIGSGDYVTVRFLQQPEAQTRDSIVAVPLHNIVDNASWTRGNHSVTLGGNWRMISNITATNANSFNGASTNPSWLSPGDRPHPENLPGAGLAAVASGFLSNFEQAYATIVGDVPELLSNPNYSLTSSTQAGLLSDGSLISRNFKTNEFEYFVQDSWRVKPNLTLTFGVRHTVLQTPYEVHGQQISPTTDTHEWAQKREQAALQGQVFEDDLYFAPSGKYWGKPGFWAKQKSNFAPRVAMVYSPDGKTSIRAGAGLYFDHFGEALSQRFSTLGSFGLSSQLQSAPGAVGFESAPRFTGPHDLPDLPIAAAPGTQSYPYAVPDGSFGINWGIDNHVKTPYVYAYNLSFQHQFPGGFLFEESYVGRFGRHLFQQYDLAEPVNFNDPQGGGDYFTNGSLLSKIADQHGGDASATVPTIQYFEDVFPQMKNTDYDGESATQAIYSDEWAPVRYSYGETQALVDIDVPGAGCGYGGYCSGTNAYSKFWSQQFSSLISLASLGSSSYNALQASLRHPMSHGLAMDISYTLSKSIDMGSDTERSATSYGAIQNTWAPRLSRGVSDFDTRHLITGDWTYDMPFGRGRPWLTASNRAVDAVVGGWQWAGLVRWTSSLPYAFIEPGWTTNWELQAWAVPTTNVKTHKHLDSSGLPQIFNDPNAIGNGIYTGNPIRLPYPGEAGPRNGFRGDGVFNIDSSLAKTWNFTESARLKFVWEVFNVTNTNRFDTAFLGNALSYQGFGYYSSEPSKFPFRRMEFGLRFDF